MWLPISHSDLRWFMITNKIRIKTEQFFPPGTTKCESPGSTLLLANALGSSQVFMVFQKSQVYGSLKSQVERYCKGLEQLQRRHNSEITSDDIS